MGTCRTLSHVRHTQNKKCLSDQSHSRFPEESTKEEGEEEKEKDTVFSSASSKEEGMMIRKKSKARMKMKVHLFNI